MIKKTLIIATAALTLHILAIGSYGKGAANAKSEAGPISETVSATIPG